MGIGKRLKEARINANLTQNELAKMVGITTTAITNYEKETSHPREQIMYALIDALNVEPNFIYQDCVTTIKDSAVLDSHDQNLIIAYHNATAEIQNAVDFLLKPYQGQKKTLD